MMVLARLRDGSWLTFSRARLWASAALIASAAGAVYLLATAHGLTDYLGRPLGTDFSNVYAAGTYVLEGNPAAAFDPRLQYAREVEIFGAGTPFYGWHYPPFFLWIAAALALLPYPAALAVWQGATLILYLLAMRMIVGRGRQFDVTSAPPTQRPAGEHQAEQRHALPWLLPAVAFPAAFVNLGHGHNGFLTAALFGFALVNLDARPLLAGVMFGLLAYKPQFGIMVPLVLVATGRWRSILTASAIVVLLALVTTLAFGMDTWRAFFHFAEYTRATVLETGETGWHKIQGVFSWARMWGASVALAYAIQGALTITLAGAIVWLWRSAAAFELKAAALCLIAVLATPYSLDYDLMVVAPAIAFLAMHGLRRGFAPYEITMLAALWLAPLVTRTVAHVTLVPLATIATLGLVMLLLRGAYGEHANVTGKNGPIVIA